MMQGLSGAKPVAKPSPDFNEDSSYSAYEPEVISVSPNGRSSAHL